MKSHVLTLSLINQLISFFISLFIEGSGAKLKYISNFLLRKVKLLDSTGLGERWLILELPLSLKICYPSALR